MKLQNIIVIAVASLLAAFVSWQIKPCPSTPNQCTELFDNKYVKGKVISTVSRDGHLGFVSFGEPHGREHLAMFSYKDVTSPTKFNLHDPVYFKAQNCNFQKDSIVRIIDLIQASDLGSNQVFTPDPTSSIYYHNFFDHDHTAIHRIGHYNRQSSTSISLDGNKIELALDKVDQPSNNSRGASSLRNQISQSDLNPPDVFEVAKPYLKEKAESLGSGWVWVVFEDGKIIDIDKCHMHDTEEVICREDIAPLDIDN